MRYTRVKGYDHGETLRFVHVFSMGFCDLADPPLCVGARGHYVRRVALALLRWVWNVIRLPLLPLWWLGRITGRPRAEWIVVKLNPAIVELPPARAWLMRFLPGAAATLPTPLVVLRRLAKHAIADRQLEGVVFEIPHLATGWSTAQGLRDVIDSLRQGGKKVVAYLPQGGGNVEAWIASAADEIYLSPQATLMLLGLSLKARYLKPLLDKLGIGFEAFARGEYKTAAESVVRDSMSDAQREQLSALLATLDGALRRGLERRPRLDASKVDALFEAGMIRGQEAVDMGFADGLAYEDELARVVGTSSGKRERPAKMVRAPRYFAFHEKRFFRRVLPAPYVAIVEVDGAISERPGKGGIQPVVAALRAARADRRALGVVLHVQSPGGSALASDLVYREVQRLRERKPVVACFGDVAASGGYYIAMATDTIVAQPTTITGSIGVVAARMVAHELLETVGVKTETLRAAPHADMFSPSRDLTDEERAILDRELDGFYGEFVELVAKGRGKTPEEIDAVARGRVWSGADAKERGLVDTLGGLDVAVDAVLDRARVPSAIRRFLEPKAVRPRKLEMAPPEPPAKAAQLFARLAAAVGPRVVPAAAIADQLAPEVRELLELVGGADRVLYYAPGLPKIE